MSEQAKTPLIETIDLKKFFRVKKGMLHAVDGISMRIMRGETFGVVGESGCGKSTLGRTMIRLYEPTGGKILYLLLRQRLLRRHVRARHHGTGCRFVRRVQFQLPGSARAAVRVSGAGLL